MAGASLEKDWNSSRKEPADDDVHRADRRRPRRQAAMAPVQGARQRASHDLPHHGPGAGAVPDLLRAITKGDLVVEVLLSMLGGLADRSEQAAADRTPIRVVVGADPVAFAEAFFGNYSHGRWINRERDRSVSAVEREVIKEIERGFNKERGRLVKAVERAQAQEGATRS